MMRMRNMAKKKESRTPRMICSSLVSRLSTGDGERETERAGATRSFSTLRTNAQLHTCDCNYLLF